MAYCEEKLECKYFDTAHCDEWVGTGCFAEKDEAIETPQVLPSNSSALLYAHEQCRTMPHVEMNGVHGYIIGWSDDAISNEEHFKNYI